MITCNSQVPPFFGVPFLGAANGQKQVCWCLMSGRSPRDGSPPGVSSTRNRLQLKESRKYDAAVKWPRWLPCRHAPRKKCCP
jgi:hypothetical protein